MRNLLRPQAIAKILDVSRSSILRMIKDGSLPAVILRSGKRKKILRIREEDLEKWITIQMRQQSANKAGKSRRRQEEASSIIQMKEKSNGS